MGTFESFEELLKFWEKASCPGARTVMPHLTSTATIGLPSAQALTDPCAFCGAPQNPARRPRRSWASARQRVVVSTFQASLTKTVLKNLRPVQSV